MIKGFSKHQQKKLEQIIKRRLIFVRITFGFAYSNDPRKVYYRKIEGTEGLGKAMNEMLSNNGTQMTVEEQVCLLEEFQKALKELEFKPLPGNLNKFKKDYPIKPESIIENTLNAQVGKIRPKAQSKAKGALKAK